MTALLVVIGHDADNRLNISADQLAAEGVGTLSVCSPGCTLSSVLTIPGVRLPSGAAVAAGGFTDHVGFRPAEAYVLAFTDAATAQGFAQRRIGASGLASRTVLLLEDLDLPPPPSLSSPASLMLALDWATASRFDLSPDLLTTTEGMTPLAPCPTCCVRCKDTGLAVAVPLDKAGNPTPPQSLTPGLAAPAQAYLLRFNQRSTAVAFAANHLPLLSVGDKTVLLLDMARSG